jgi:hypothetical protein
MSRTILEVQTPPTPGVETTVTVVDDLSRPVVGATVRATWRPGLAGEHSVAVGLTDARGQVPWTPKQAGTVVISARDTSMILQSGSPWPDPTSTVWIAAILLGCVGLMVAGAVSSRRQQP